MSLTWDKRKVWVPDRILTYHSNTGRALYPLELRRTRGDQGHILGTYLARISIILVLFGVRFRHHWWLLFRKVAASWPNLVAVFSVWMMSFINLLLAKVKAYGVQEPALQLLRSYLHGRKQRVICNNKCSSWSTVRCGVPQGSLLSPLLFNIFMNDINETVTVSSLRLYADDTTQYTADYSPVVLQHLLNHDMEKLSSWFASNYLHTVIFREL